MLRALAIASALAVIAARCLVRPPSNPALDPAIVLAVLGIVIAAAPRERVSEAAVVAASILLLLACAWVQLPFAIEILKLTL